MSHMGACFGSEKSKKFHPQSGFTPWHDFQKSSFCSTNPYTFIYTLLSADNRTTRHYLCDLLLKIDDFWKKSSGGNPVWGQKFSKFSLPKTCPQHTKNTGEKKFQKINTPTYPQTLLPVSPIKKTSQYLCSLHPQSSRWNHVVPRAYVFSYVVLFIHSQPCHLFFIPFLRVEFCVDMFPICALLNIFVPKLILLLLLIKTCI